jgi:hypothetical protein
MSTDEMVTREEKTMQATIELEELDALVANLDADISETVVVDEAQTPSLLICSLGCGGGWSYYHCW